MLTFYGFCMYVSWNHTTFRGRFRLFVFIFRSCYVDFSVFVNCFFSVELMRLWLVLVESVKQVSQIIPVKYSRSCTQSNLSSQIRPAVAKPMTYRCSFHAYPSLALGLALVDETHGKMAHPSSSTPTLPHLSVSDLDRTYYPLPCDHHQSCVYLHSHGDDGVMAGVETSSTSFPVLVLVLVLAPVLERHSHYQQHDRKIALALVLVLRRKGAKGKALVAAATAGTVVVAGGIVEDTSSQTWTTTAVVVVVVFSSLD